MSFISICLMLSWRPEKTLLPDRAGTARIKQHKRWAGMLLEKAGLQQCRHQGGLLMWRGRPSFSFLEEVHLCENSQAVQSEVVSGLFSYSSTIRTVLALFTSFIALLLTVWEVYSHRFYTLVRLKFAQMSWDHFLARLLQQRSILLLGQIHTLVCSVLHIQCSSSFKVELECLSAFI